MTALAVAEAADIAHFTQPNLALIAPVLGWLHRYPGCAKPAAAAAAAFVAVAALPWQP